MSVNPRIGSSVNERDGGDDDRGGKGEGIWSGKDRNNFMLLVLLCKSWRGAAQFDELASFALLLYSRVWLLLAET
jgi:hypothetical protein